MTDSPVCDRCGIILFHDQRFCLSMRPDELDYSGKHPYCISCAEWLYHRNAMRDWLLDEALREANKRMIVRKYTHPKVFS